QVVGAQTRLELAHLPGRNEPRVDADGALERDGRLHRLAHLVVDAEEVPGVTEAARAAVDTLGEVLEELERVTDHPAGLGRRVMLSHAGRALSGAARCDRPLVEHDHVTDATPG